MKILAFCLIALLLMSCAAGRNPNRDVPNEKMGTASFFQGLWHGVILPVTFVVSLFTPEVNVYETHNNGGWYNFGFLLGCSIILGGGGGAGGAMRRRNR
jgi:hypothetical protein